MDKLVRNPELGKYLIAKDNERGGRAVFIELFNNEFSFILGGLCIELSAMYSRPEIRGRQTTGPLFIEVLK